MRKSFQSLKNYAGLISLEKSWLRWVKTEIYKAWTGTEQVLKEQLSIFSSTTRTEVYHGKALGRVCEQGKGNVFPQTNVGHKILLTRGLAWEAEAQAVRREYSWTVTQALGFQSSHWIDTCQSHLSGSNSGLINSGVAIVLLCIRQHLYV